MDDNARALMVAIRALPLTGDNGLIDYIRHYLAFVEAAQRKDGRFRNFMAADGSWTEEVGSGDANARAVWTLGYTAAHSRQSEVKVRALRCLDGARPHLTAWTAPRSKAYTLLGLKYWLSMEADGELERVSTKLADDLAAEYKSNATPDWPWFEDQLTYCNGRLSQALLGADHQTIGLESLAWLCEVMEVDGVLSLVGSNGFYARGGTRAVYDQQPVDAYVTLSACLAAFQVNGDDRFRRWALMAYRWFLGDNIGRTPMVDADTGGCFDGLTPGGVNTNEGAESLLSWLAAQEDLLEAGLSP